MSRPAPPKTQVNLVYAVNALSGNSVLTYVMKSAPNAPTTAADWQIMKLTYDASDNILLGIYPRNSETGNASAEYVFIADNYASYTYGAA